MWKRMLREAAAEALEEMLPDLQDIARSEATSHTNLVGIDLDQLWVGGGKEYVLIDHESQQYELIDAVFDFGELKLGDAVELEIFVRFPWGLKRHLFHKEEGPVQDPALTVPTLLCPSGVQIRIKHSTGPNRQIGYCIVRRR